MTDDVTTVDGKQVDVEGRDGRVSLNATVEEGALVVRTDPDQLVEGFPVAELQITGDGVETSIMLTASATAGVIDALQEAER